MPENILLSVKFLWGTTGGLQDSEEVYRTFEKWALKWSNIWLQKPDIVFSPGYQGGKYGEYQK